MTATVIANKYTTDIPYTAMMTKYFYDGSTTTYPVEGMFKGVSISEVQVQYSEAEDVFLDIKDRRRRSSEISDTVETSCWKVFESTSLRQFAGASVFTGSAENCRKECLKIYPNACTGSEL